MAARRRSRNSRDADFENDHRDRRVLSPEVLLREMFEEQSGDWEMVGTDGKSFKFHQNVLAKQVQYFRAFFSDQNSMECKRKQVVVLQQVNMDGTGVEAFLRFVYYNDSSAMDKSFSVTCALIRAGHLYKVPCLVEVASQKIEERGAGDAAEALKWFNVEELWELYEKACSWKETYPARTKLLESIAPVLKMYCQHKEHQDTLLLITGVDEQLRRLLLPFILEPTQRPCPSSPVRRCRPRVD